MTESNLMLPTGRPRFQARLANRIPIGLTPSPKAPRYAHTTIGRQISSTESGRPEFDDLARLVAELGFTKSSSCFSAEATTGPIRGRPEDRSPSSTCNSIGEDTRKPPRRSRAGLVQHGRDVVSTAPIGDGPRWTGMTAGFGLVRST